MTRLVWLCLFCLSILPAACDDDDDDNDVVEPGPVVPQVVEVSLLNDLFTPDDLTVTIGTTVRWINDDEDEHTVTSGIDNSDPNAGIAFDSDVLSPGDVYEVDFINLGDFDYFCQFHVSEGMVGVVRVVP